MAPALAAQRAVDVLRYLALHPDEQPTLTALAERLSVSPAAMHAVLAALSESGLVERREHDKTYRLGLGAVVLGCAARSGDEVMAQSALAAAGLAARHHVSASVLARRGDEIIVVEAFGPLLGDELPQVGGRLAYAPPHGAALAATAPPHEVIAWLQRGGLDPAGAPAELLRRELADIGERGWALAPGDPGAAPVVLAAVPTTDGTSSSVCLAVTCGPGCDVETLAAELAQTVGEIGGSTVGT